MSHNAHNVSGTNHTEGDVLAANVMTVFEHQYLTRRDMASAADFHWLLAQGFAVFSVRHKRGEWQLKVGHYVGVVLLPSGMMLEILPKPLAKNENTQAKRPQHRDQVINQADSHAVHHKETAQTRRWVQSMLSDLAQPSAHHKPPRTKTLGQMSHQIAPLHSAALPLSEWLVAQFLQRLTHYQPTKHYQTQVANQASLQGRLLIKEQLRCNAMQPHKFVCENSVMSQDMLGNRLIKSALVRLMPLLPKPLCLSSLQPWQSIPPLTHKQMTQLASVHSRAKHQLAIQPLRPAQQKAAQQLMDWAYWLLQQTASTGHGVEMRPSSHPSLSQPRLCLLIDMNQAFEQWASQRIAARFQQARGHYHPLYQMQRVWLNDDAGQACLSVRPDLLIYQTPDKKSPTLNKADMIRGEVAGRYTHVIDIKWKPLSSASAISASDAYQLMSYAQAYQASQIWLVYPVNDDSRQAQALKQHAYDNHKPKTAAPILWLVPFNVVTGRLNSDLLPDLDVV